MTAYTMTPARRAALRKAQLASARKRRKGGSRSNVKRISAAVGVVGVIGGSAYVYKNREKLIISKIAERSAIKRAKLIANSQGKKLGKAQIRKVRMQERRDHASRSTYRVREYSKARRHYRNVSKWSHGKLNIRPSGYAGSVYDNKQLGLNSSSREQWQSFFAYRRDVHSRAVQRLGKRTGKKNTFGYSSGKRLLVSNKGKVKRAFW